MPESDLLQILLSHDRWATAQLLGACGGLTADQFYRRFDIGPGSLHDTLTHSQPRPAAARRRKWSPAARGTGGRCR